jgi:DnaJ-class molecular chaperone
VALNVPANSNTGAVLRLKGKGPRPWLGSAARPAGDLYVRLVVTLPDKPDASSRNSSSRLEDRIRPRAKLR